MKKIISIITVAILLMAMTITAFAFPEPSGDKDAWIAADEFSPLKFDVPKATTNINIDGVAAIDDAYTDSEPIPVGRYTEYNGLDSDDGAYGTAYVVWDNDYLYIHFTVEDDTNFPGDDFEHDSVEIYLDYDQTADGKKVKWNKVSSSDTYSAQYRVQRGGESLDVAVSSNSTMTDLVEGSEIAVEETGTGYVVEAKIPLKDEDGDYIPKSNSIGFELQINDNPDGYSRQSAAYIQSDIQYYAYEYSHLFDTIVLAGGESLAWSDRTVQTAINESLANFDPNSVYVAPSKAPSSAVSSVVSKATSSKATSSKAASSKETSSAASVISTVSDVASTLEQNNITNNDTDIDVDVNNETNINNEENNGGLPTSALIGIIAGGVVLLAAAAAAIIIVVKKKKGAAPAEAEATDEAEATEEVDATEEPEAEEPTEE